MVSHWSLSDSKFQVFRTLLSIVADLNNAIVWMVSSRPLILKLSSPFINLSVTVSRAPITIGVNVTFMVYSFFQFSSKVELLILLFIIIIIIIIIIIFTWKYVIACNGGTFRAIFIVETNGHDDSNSNPGLGCLHFILR